jgi:hypothetical protein
VFTPFHKPPYTYPYGRSVDKTTTASVYISPFLSSLMVRGRSMRGPHVERRKFTMRERREREKEGSEILHMLCR